MSKWHALEGSTFEPDAFAGIDVTYWPLVAFEDRTTSIADGLSDPAGDDLADAAGALLPEGAAWSKPDGEALPRATNLWQFWRAVSAAFVDAYRDAWRVTMDSTSITLVSSLDDWEEEFGLPDPCVGLFQSDAKRFAWLREKVLSTGVISITDFLGMADRLGYAVVIEEPIIAEAGAFECGGPDETGTPDSNHLVVFWILGAGEYGFEAGAGEAGYTPLYDFDQAAAVECRFRELLPAGFWPVFDYSELATFTGWPGVWPTAWE